MSTFARILTAFLIAVLAPDSAPIVRDGLVYADDALVGRFWAEAPVAWRAYGESDLSIEGSHVITTTDMRSGKVVDQSTREFQFAGEWAVFTDRRASSSELRDVADSSPLAHVYGTNSRYCFQLALGSHAEDWVVERLSPLEEAQSDENGMAWYAKRGASPFGTPLVLYPGSLPEIASSKHFAVSGARSMRLDNEEVVELRFSYMPPSARSVTIPSGTLVLDPRRFWLIRTAELEEIFPRGEVATVSVRNELDDATAQIPLIKSYSARIRVKPQGQGIENVVPTDYLEKYEYNLRRIKSPLERDFSLTAFGLPEPYQPENAWLWWSLGIGLALLAGAYLWRRAAAR
jgi:hypothetical protein